MVASTPPTNKTFRTFVSRTFILSLVLTTLVGGFFPAKIFAANDSAELDLKRRSLHTLAECLEQNRIDESDEDGKISDFGDLFDNNADTNEIIAVGFDRESTNGAMTCASVIEQGQKQFDPNSRLNYQDWFMKKLTGKTLDETGGGSIDDENLETNRQNFYNEVKAAESRIEAPNNALRKDRFIQLAPLCYTMEETPKKALGADDFEVNGVGYFYLKNRDEIKATIEPWIKKNNGTGSVTNAELGDIDLGWRWSTTIGGDSIFEANKSDFFPIGSDVSQSSGYHHNAIVDCPFVKSHQNIIFAGTQVKNGQLIDSATGKPIAGTVPTGGDKANEDNSCESKGGPLGWIMCPVVNALDGVFNHIDSLLQSLLTVDQNKYQDVDMENVWKRIRDTAYLVIVPMMLFMVISTALGFEFVSAYTVKKAFPRMLIGIMFIALSWPLLTFLVEITNNAGQATLGFVTSALQGDNINTSDGVTLQDLYAPSIGGAGVQIVGAVGFIGGAILAASSGPILLLLLSILLGAVVTMLTAFFVLVARQILIVALLILAPIAILSWVFPGNDKLWKLWWQTFSKMLLMYPLIMILIASGRIGAYVIGNADSSGLEGAVLNPILKLVAYTIPYAMIPATFKFAGGLLGNIAGVGKGLGGLTKGLRGRALGNIKSSARSGDLFKTRTIAGKQLGGTYGGKFTSRASRMAQGASLGYKGKFGLGNGADTAYDSALANEAAALMKTDAYAAQSENDHILRAAAAGTTRTEAIANMQKLFKNADGTSQYNEEQARKHVMAAEKTLGLGRAQQLAAAQQLVATGTGYDDLNQMKAVLANASNGNRQTASRLAGFANATTKKVGRNDLAPGFSNLDRAVRFEMDNGGGAYMDVGEVAPSQEDMQLAAWKSGSLYTHANSKPKNIEAAIKHFQTEFNEGRMSAEKYGIFHEELKAILPNSTGDVADRILEATSSDNPSAQALKTYYDDNPSTPAQSIILPDGSTQRVGGTQSARERVIDQSRTYQRPNPENLD